MTMFMAFGLAFEVPVALVVLVKMQGCFGRKATRVALLFCSGVPL